MAKRAMGGCTYDSDAQLWLLSRFGLLRGQPTASKPREHSSAETSDAPLQGCNGESLDDGFRWLRLHHNFLSEHHPFPSFGCWLHLRFDSAQPWKGEDAHRLHFTSSDLSERSDYFSAHRLLEVHLGGERFGKRALAHSRARSLHRPHRLHRFHRLHGRHAGLTSARERVGEGRTEAPC